MTEPSSGNAREPSGAVVTTVQQPKVLPNRCGFCKQSLGTYPPVTIPLGRIQWIVDERAAAANLDIKNGYVNEVSACIACAQIYLSTARYNDGEIVRDQPKVVEVKGIFFKSIRCQTCSMSFSLKEKVDFIFCPFCGVGHQVKKN